MEKHDFDREWAFLEAESFRLVPTGVHATYCTRFEVFAANSHVGVDAHRANFG